MGCRFPGNVRSPEEYWQLLSDGVDAVGPMPPERWAAARRHLPLHREEQPPHGGFLAAIDQFDAAFFGISGREAESMDPQQRLLLEVAWEAIERAGMDASRLKESKTGVFIGVTTTDYARISLGQGPDKLDAYTATGNALNVTAGRIAFALGLNGPAMAVDTACSSSLVAIHLACQSLRLKESDMALAGGVNVILSLEAFICFNRWGMMASDGRCKTFDEKADGFVRGEGCGLLVLKRLSDAEASGDPILAVIRGSAVNQDGASSGLTVPNGPAQEAVIRKALASAGLSPEALGYVEAHGTGTRLGDPIELEALVNVLGGGRSAERPLRVGSVKTNLGHLESAAGVAGVIKVILALQHQAIPPHLHFSRLSPQIQLGDTALEVPTRMVPWSTQRMAGVSAFGFSGTNAHVILEAAPAREPATPDTRRPRHLLALSAKTPDALAELARRYSTFFDNAADDAAADACFTANTGRVHFKHRLAVNGDRPADLARQLAALHGGTAQDARPRAEEPPSRSPGVAMLFTGQGAQYVGMGRQLFETQPTFRAVLERCDALLRPELSAPLLSVLYPAPDKTEEARRLIDQTGFAQPALFALGYALAELWRAWGVTPAAVMGHSVGEYVAACVAGVFTLEEGLRLIAARGRLMQALPAGGRMAALFTDEQTAQEAIAAFDGSVSLAALNGPANTVISGTAPAVAAVQEALQGRGIGSARLNVSHAFHSGLVEPMLAEFERVAAGVRYDAPRIDLVSNVTAEPIGSTEIDAVYWRRHARQPVRFMPSLRRMHGLGYRWFIEAGPQPVLSGMASKIDDLPNAHWLPSLGKSGADWAHLLESLGHLYVHGASMDWQGFDLDYQRNRVLLPTYPFQRRRFWVRSVPAAQQPQPERETGHPLIHRVIRSPRLAELALETILETRLLPYLEDHRIFGTTVVPAALLLEVALAAGARRMAGRSCRVEAFSIEAPLVIEKETPATLQTILGPIEKDAAGFEIYSLAHEASRTWQRHAAGRLVWRDVSAVGPGPGATPGDEADDSASQPDEAYYGRLNAIGIEYGPAFKGLCAIEHKDGHVTSHIRLSEALGPDSGDYFLHPAMLDMGFQLLGAAFKETQRSEVYLPIGVDCYQVRHPGGCAVTCRAALRDAALGAEIRTGDIQLYGAGGELLADIQGLRIKRATRETLAAGVARSRAADLGLHVAEWMAVAPLPDPAPGSLVGLWLIFTDGAGAGGALGDELRRQGAQVHFVEAAEAYCAAEPDHTRVRATEAADFRQLFARCSTQGPFKGVVYLWGIRRRGAPDRLSTQTETGVDAGAWPGLLHLLQALAPGSGEAMPHLTIVTAGATSVASPPEVVDPDQTLLWGFGRTIAAEYPLLGCRLVDLDPTSLLPESGASLLREVGCADRWENQVALRAGGRLGLRLIALKGPSASAIRESLPYKLSLVTPGLIERFERQPITPLPPRAGEVQIHVEVTGLNFRDVLNALGMYPGDAGPLGNECVGRISAVGEGVTRFRPGDAVMAITPMAFCSHVNALADLVAHRPARLTAPEAATIPITFLTAWYAFHQVAHIKAGQRVLIHAAAGGVGMAALQLAQLAGAEIFATAGSPAKRALLREMGIAHVMDSRSLAFADQVRAATSGRGVDLVLNSLSGDFIPASLGLVVPGGHFLEIGKSDAWDAEQVAKTFPGVIHSRVFLGGVCQTAPALVRDMFEAVLALFRQERLTPLPLRLFSINEVASAFRFMAQARHVGKIVIDQREATPVHIRSDATYLITGGLGGLGLCFARWLAEQGARHLILNARREPGEDARAQIQRLENAGLEVKICLADLSRPEDVRALLANVDPQRPLKGIIHAAGALDDATLAHLTPERMTAVLGPKVTGALWLHRLTRSQTLEFFMLCSAGASLFGSPGQASYAAANAFLDGLAWRRRAEGLPALSVNWGPWAEVGMAATMTQRDLQRWEAMGVGTILPAQGVRALERALAQTEPQVAILAVDWQIFQRYAGGKTIPAFLDEMASGPAARGARPPEVPSKAPVREQWLAANSEARGRLLENYLAERAAGELLIPVAELDRATPLPMAGFDSLMAVQLKNRIEAELGIRVDMVVFLEGRSLQQLAAHLALLLADGSAAGGAGVDTGRITAAPDGSKAWDEGEI